MKVDPQKGAFNPFKLNGSSLDHTGSSGVRENRAHPERFDLLCTFSKDGEAARATGASIHAGPRGEAAAVVAICSHLVLPRSRELAPLASHRPNGAAQSKLALRVRLRSDDAHEDVGLGVRDQRRAFGPGRALVRPGERALPAVEL
ncbi:MAG: hypothetical protein IPJ65_36710 [Archangiaceae bacterium]|nr:hypothetical protein [Archangiaceae bacterium]